MESTSKEFIEVVSGRSHSLNSTVNQTQVSRWLENDSIVELKLKRQTYRNAEFYVNGNDNHCIWFSQLAQPLLKISSLELVLGRLIKKHGDSICMFDMSNVDFINYVANKRFRVIVNEEGSCAKMKVGNMTYGELQEKIQRLYEEGKYYEAAQFLEPANLYSLEEL